MRENAHLRQASFAQTGLTRPCLEIMRDFTSSESRLFTWFLSFVQVLLRHRSYAADSDQMCRSKEEKKSVNEARNASVNPLFASLKCLFCSNRGGNSSTPRFCQALVPLVFRLFCRWAWSAWSLWVRFACLVCFWRRVCVCLVSLCACAAAPRLLSSSWTNSFLEEVPVPPHVALFFTRGLSQLRLVINRIYWQQTSPSSP